MQNFLPTFVADQLTKKKSSGTIEGTVLFVDVSGFTSLTEVAFKLGDAGAELMSRELTRIFDPMVQAVHNRGGFIANFMGDAFTAVFPKGKGSARRALDASHEIIEFFKKHGTSKTRHGDFEFGVKIGVEHGDIEWGIVHDKKHKARQWYFRGAAVDGAAGAEHKAKRGKIELGKAMKKLDERKDPPGKPKKTAAVSDKKTLKKFFHDSVIDAGERAELRHVVSLFLRFDGAKDHKTIDKVFGALLAAGERHGGTINKIDFGDKGFTALVFFGAPIAAENAESAAIAFAQSLPVNGLNTIKGVTMSAGIDAGLVYSGLLGGENRNEWTCIGDAVNTSARLMTGAETGQTLVTDRVQKAAEKRWEFADKGTRILKGKAKETRVLQPTALRGRMRGFTYRNPMLGRDKELADLLAFVDPAWAAEPKFAGVKRILGEPGLGKTRLVAALRAKLEERGRPFHWITMPCDGVHKSGWNAVSSWLRAFFAIAESASQEAKRKAIEDKYAEFENDPRIPENTRSELKRTLSFAADLVDCHWDDSPFAKLDDPKLRHENRIIAVKELLRALAGIAPTVLEVEDTHWIDASTAAWLTAMTRNIATLPLAIICTSRFTDDGSKPELQIAQDVELQDFELQPISGDEFTQQMAKVLLGDDKELDNETVKLISGKAKGNPFFTEQLILHLNETGELESVQVPTAADEGAKRTKLKMKSTDTARLPGSLSSLVTARIDRLSPEVRETVKHASILGVRFLSRVLGELLKRSGKVTRSLEELLLESEREGVLIPAERAEAAVDEASQAKQK
ncbi:MAG: AAA family ATPase [Planctomycetes bacterium]|nr:AAA family ATPase [Planctomycetota bacterium]MCW8136722.1 AAA family ATPase [Planctomycetota bacterium]